MILQLQSAFIKAPPSWTWSLCLSEFPYEAQTTFSPLHQCCNYAAEWAPRRPAQVRFWCWCQFNLLQKWPHVLTQCSNDQLYNIWCQMGPRHCQSMHWALWYYASSSCQWCTPSVLICPGPWDISCKCNILWPGWWRKGRPSVLADGVSVGLVVWKHK